jgi:hypothetical protein
MTRFLRAALGANEPTFSQSIRQLEQAAGLPCADIRLTSEITRRLRDKMVALGLDPADTTGEELYAALHLKLGEDEKTVREALGIASGTSADSVIARVYQYLNKHDMPRNCFALKTSVAKKLLKNRPPKTAMKRLGYRSVDSMLKHEAPAQLYTAALMTEAGSWHRNFRDQYAKLTPSDFESRKITLFYPQTKRWQELSKQFVANAKHNMLGFRELGAVVLLPMQEDVEGLAITTILLTLEEMNAIRAQSSYTKLQQVKPHFGQVIQESLEDEPYTSARLAGQPVPWRMIQRYYARFKEAYHPEVFEPHVQPEDLQWYHGEDALAKLAPSLSFWQDSSMLTLVHNDEPISLNILDVALSFCNHLPFNERIVHFLRDNLWHELMMRYLNQENLEAAVHKQIADELEEPLAFAEQEAYNTGKG